MSNRKTFYNDIVYGSDDQLLDVCRPMEQEEQVLPVIVCVHGSGWMYGDRESYLLYCRSLAQDGFAVVSCDAWGDLADINRVFGWMLAHAAEYGLDTDHVFAVGDYEGAHQLAAYCNFLTNPACAAKYPFTPPEGLGILGLALNSGTYAIAPNVLEYVTVHFPPTFVMTCTDDPLIGQALHMIKALIGKGVTHELQIYGNSEMGLEQSFYRDQCGFFRTLL